MTILVSTPEGIQALTYGERLVLRALDALGGGAAVDVDRWLNSTMPTADTPWGVHPPTYANLHAKGWIRPRWRPPVTDPPHMAGRKLPARVRDGWELARPLPEG